MLRLGVELLTPQSGCSLGLLTQVTLVTQALTPLTRSAALCFALLFRSVYGLAHSLRSLPRRTVENHEYVFIKHWIVVVVVVVVESYESRNNIAL